eukprot:g4678.t1
MTRFQLLSLLLCGCLLLSSTLRPVKGEEDEYEEIEDEEGGDEEKEGDFDESDVVVLNKDNFQEKIDSVKYALVEFYAPWCGHCKALAPEYAKAATALKAYDDKIILAKVDATENSELAEKYDVQGYPTLKWFVDGKASEFSGGRDEESIVRWVKKKTGPPAETITKTSELEATEKENEAFVVGYFSAFEGKEFEAFLDAARVADDAVYVQTTSKEVATAAGITGDKTLAIVMVKNFEGYEREVTPFDKDITVANLEEFVTAERLPLVVPFIEKNQERIFSSGIEKQVLVLVSGEKLKAGESFLAMLNSVAKSVRGKLMYVSVDLDNEASATPVINFFGVNKEDAPIVLGFQIAGNRKYKFEKEVNEANLKSWSEDLIAGKIEPSYKSQDPPEVDEEDNVKIVVGKTFDNIVKDPKKDVLLEIYAPWCGHCKSLEPIYKKLGKRFASIESVVIAKMDGTENEHADVEVTGFPALYLFPAGDGAEKVAFEGGDRTLLALTKFIKTHAKIPYELTKKKGTTKEEPADDDAKEEPDTPEIKEEL